MNLDFQKNRRLSVSKGREDSALAEGPQEKNNC